jgi:N-methylhydantoinase A
MATRIAVDIGGTFTDLVYYDEASGRTYAGKVPTVPDAPEKGVLNAVRLHVPEDVLRAAKFFIHGTTVGLNALLERRGATVGLLTTDGFRDALEFRRGDRVREYDLNWRPPVPLVPRHLRLGIKERVMSDGTIFRPLQEDSILDGLEIFRKFKVDTIAVCLIHSHANPMHELRVEELLRGEGFQGGISLSHRISGEHREYERTSTTVIDAFVRLRMSNYLEQLEAALRGIGFRGTCLIARSGGGSMRFSEGAERPFETINSGPVGCVQGACELAEITAASGVIAADVGGTSFDTSLVVNGAPHLLYQGEVGGFPVQSPWIDVRSIGSGGGSIIRIDEGGLLQVGPQSAGAVPGPASYAKGGVLPTTTDAAAVLGMLGRGKLAGDINLDFDAAQRAFEPVSKGIKKSVRDTAVGVLHIAASHMANAVREITIQQGLDPREMVLLPVGGAGPMIGTLLADELGIKQIVLPAMAGNFSAWGLLSADMVQTASRTRVLTLGDDNIVTINETLRELFAVLHQREPDFAEQARPTLKLDMRYRGQDHSVSVLTPLDGRQLSIAARELRALFEKDYFRTYDTKLTDPVEITAVRASLVVPLDRPNSVAQTPAEDGSDDASSEAWSFTESRMMPFKLLERNSIGSEFDGPAIITEATTTTYVDAGWSVRPGAHSELLLVKKGIR